MMGLPVAAGAGFHLDDGASGAAVLETLHPGTVVAQPLFITGSALQWGKQRISASLLAATGDTVVVVVIVDVDVDDAAAGARPFAAAAAAGVATGTSINTNGVIAAVWFVSCAKIIRTAVDRRRVLLSLRTRQQQLAECVWSHTSLRQASSNIFTDVIVDRVK
jgi:hypothetical protein